MWRGGQGGVGLAPCSATEGVLGAAGTGTTATTTTTIDKTHYDSQNDSGFLSGSNLTSSCSLSEDSDTMRFSEPLPPLGETKGDALASSRVDSGIDISEQLSSLQLASSSTSTTTSTSELEGEDTPQRRTVTPPPRRSRLGLSEEQMALLQEIFKRDEDGDTQLHVAVMRGFIEVVYHITRLLPHQALLDLANHQGKTALHLAVAAGDTGAARHLLICGASPVERDRRGNTPLHVAAAAGQAAMVAHLTRPVTEGEVMGARLAYAPAHTAGLLAADLTNYDGQTCIHLAAQGGHRDILQHLTWYGADINAREGKSGRTALHYAVEARDPELVVFLAESCRVSLTLETYAGLTPYQLAQANGASGLATLLLELGSPGEELPHYLAAEDDPDYDEHGPCPENNGWGIMDDLRIGGIPVPLAMALPVTDASGPLNADHYF
uniref:Uncharacterized protein n=1 Tax=Scylla olivacea TaxID=85551 RepID=A0A0P4WDM5_SCYOL